MFSENQWIKIKAPATVANMVCGFDILGFAVNSPYDEMEMRWTSRAENEASITIINIDNYNLPTDPEKNVAGAALLAFLEEYEEKQNNSNTGFIFCTTRPSHFHFIIWTIHSKAQNIKTAYHIRYSCRGFYFYPLIFSNHVLYLFKKNIF